MGVDADKLSQESRQYYVEMRAKLQEAIEAIDKGLVEEAKWEIIEAYRDGKKLYLFVDQIIGLVEVLTHQLEEQLQDDWEF